MFNIEEKVFLKQINIRDKETLIKEIKKIEPEDSFSEEFLNDLLKKLENIEDNIINF